MNISLWKVFDAKEEDRQLLRSIPVSRLYPKAWIRMTHDALTAKAVYLMCFQ
jgi:hypothetical protein